MSFVNKTKAFYMETRSVFTVKKMNDIDKKLDYIADALAPIADAVCSIDTDNEHLGKLLVEAQAINTDKIVKALNGLSSKVALLNHTLEKNKR